MSSDTVQTLHTYLILNIKTQSHTIKCLHGDISIFLLSLFSCLSVMGDSYLTKIGFRYLSSNNCSLSVFGLLDASFSLIYYPPITPYLVEGISYISRSYSLTSPVFIRPKSPKPINWQNRLRKVDPTTVVKMTTMKQTVFM